LLPLSVAAYAALFQGSDVTLLHACAKQPKVPPKIPLRLLSLGADPNALSELSVSAWSRERSCILPTLQKLSVLASAVRHRAVQTQLALLTCHRLVLVAEEDAMPWFQGGFSYGSEHAGVWPTQRDNHAAGEKQSLWWRDNLDDAFRFMFLAREYFLQLTSGHVLMRPKTSHHAQATLREWSTLAATNFGYHSLLSFVEEWLASIQPEVLQLVYLLVTEGTDAATEYAHGRYAGEKRSNEEMAGALLNVVEVRTHCPPLRACCSSLLFERDADTRRLLCCLFVVVG
jgi:hypothetical protein